MAGRLKLITGPASEPVTTADLRNFAHGLSDDVTDGILVPLIATARRAAEGYLNRALITQTWELVFDSFPCLPVDLPKPLLASLVSVKVTDINGTTTTMNTSDFVVDTSGCKGRISLKYGKVWPSVTPETAGVVIRFTCGYGNTGADVPDQFNTAIKVGALWLYDHPGEEMTPAFYTLLNPDGVIPV